MEPNEMHETRTVMLAQGKVIKDLQAQINSLVEPFEVHHHQQGKDITGSPILNSQDEDRIGALPFIPYTHNEMDSDGERIHRKELRTELRQLAAEAGACCPRGFAERIDNIADRV